MAEVSRDRKVHINGLDGMRGFFIVSVLMVHLQLWNAGWFAMPMFFVMSGYLITRTLLADRESGSRLGAFLLRFYARRVTRIAPVYYIYLVFVGLFGLMVGQFDAMKPYLASCFFFVSNYFFLTPGAVNVHDGPGRLFLHTWSLAVEEQFYLIWPLIIGMVPAKRLPVAMWIIGLSSIAFRCVVVFGWHLVSALPQEPMAKFGMLYLVTFNWFDAFAIGAAMNWSKWAPKRWHVYALLAFTLAVGMLNSGAGTIVILGVPRYLTFGYPALMPIHNQAVWGYTLIAINAYVLFMAVVNGGHFLSFFGHPLLDWVGKRTYSMYLFHVPAVAIYAPARKVLTDWMGSDIYSGLAVLPIVLLTAILFAHIGYTYVETPLFAYRNRLIPQWAKAPPKPTGAPRVADRASLLGQE